MNKTSWCGTDRRIAASRWCWLLIVMVWATPLFAQDGAAPDAPPDAAPAADTPTTRPAVLLNSPRATMRRFLEGVHELGIWSTESDWRRVLETMNFSQVEAGNPQVLAEQLYDILNRIEEVAFRDLPGPTDPQVIAGDPYEYFPGDPVRRMELADRLATLDRYGIHVDDLPGEIVISPTGPDGAWQFDAETVAAIPALHAALDRVPPLVDRRIVTAWGWIEQHLPRPLVRNEALGLKYWQWLALFLVILMGLVLDLLTRVVLRVVTGRLAGRGFVQRDEDSVRKTMRPFGLLAAALFWLATLNIVGLYGLAAELLEGALVVFVVLTGTLAGWRITDLLAEYLQHRAARTHSRFDDVLVPLLRKSLKLFVVVLGVVYAAGALDIDIWPLVASLGIGGVAFAFAAKDTVENFFGSVAVLLDRPFDVGDWVVIDSHEGIVETVGFRSTRIRTFYNSLISVPNANLVRAVVDNYGRRKYRRWSTTLGVQYDTPPEKLAAFTEGVRELIRIHPYTRKDYYQVYCNEFGDFALQILLYVFFEVPDWNTELRERDRLFRDIVRLADQLGVSFAFPTQTVHLYHEQKPAPGEAYEPQHRPPQLMTDRRASVDGIRAAKLITRDQPDIAEKPDPVVIRGAPTDVELDDAGNPVEEAEAAESDRAEAQRGRGGSS